MRNFRDSLFSIWTNISKKIVETVGDGDGIVNNFPIDIKLRYREIGRFFYIYNFPNAFPGFFDVSVMLLEIGFLVTLFGLENFVFYFISCFIIGQFNSIIARFSFLSRK